MNATVIGLTKEVNSVSKTDLEDEKVFSGKNAGICYQKDGYFNTSVSDPVQAGKRFSRVAGTNHHSISDHAKVEVLFENCSKMLAILLNSLQDYATSEKSGRYTVMTGNSEKETKLYDKWRVLFKKRILELYPDIDDSVLVSQMSKLGHSDVIIVDGKLSNDSMVDFDEFSQDCLRQIKSTCDTLPSTKIAQENARYVLSVFTKSTTIGYSTSLRQWNYIYDWCQKYISQYAIHRNLFEITTNNVLVKIGTTEEVSYFEYKLWEDLCELSAFIKENLYVEELRDPKNRCFSFLTNLSGDINHPMSKYRIIEADYTGYREEDVYSEDDVLGVTYNVSYPASFVHIAQAERHRTLKYFMQFNPYNSNLEFFIPQMIRGTVLESEWLDDLGSVHESIPQATMVGIVETGHIEDFILKCEERLCGRAQIEIAKQTEETAKRFLEVSDKSSVLNIYVDKLRGNKGCVNTKCKMLGVCKEPCRWISTGDVFTRKI